MAKNAVEGQETSDALSLDNLFETVPGDQYAADGIFDHQPKTWSLIDSVQRHSRAILVGVATADGRLGLGATSSAPIDYLAAKLAPADHRVTQSAVN